MFAILAGLLFTGYPVALVLGGVGLAFGFIGYLLDVFLLIQFYNLVPRIWGGVAENSVLVAVPMFIFMGTMLEKSGQAERLLLALQVLLRKVPGALALSVAGMGTIMAATTGIIGASVVMLTLLALPPMLQRGYHRSLACGTIAASGTLGILIPPSIMLVIMAEMLAISVGRLFMAAVFPGLLLSLLYILFIVVVSGLRPHLAPPLPDAAGPQNWGELVWLIATGIVPALGLILLVLGSIFAGWATVTEASAVGAAGSLLLALINRRLSFAVLHEVVDRSAITVSMIFLILLGATAFAYVFRALGGDDVVLDFIDVLGLGPWGVLMLFMVVIFVLGFFFEWIEIMLIVLPIFVPILTLLDFGDHVGTSRELVLWFGVLVAVNLQTSFLTPPFGYALFYMKGVSPPEVKMQEIYKGIVPFVLLQLLGLSFFLIFPEIALWLPRYMLG
jgi:tripartite ATP-independent transporter DctM subunit